MAAAAAPRTRLARAFALHLGRQAIPQPDAPLALGETDWPGPFERHTPHTFTRADDLERELAQIRAEEWSADREELLAGIVCLAVPVRDQAGALIAVACAASPARAHDAPAESRSFAALRGAARELAATFQLSGARREPIRAEAEEFQGAPSPLIGSLDREPLSSLRFAAGHLPRAGSAADGGGFPVQRRSVRRRDGIRAAWLDFNPS